jgi:hypothetical protein
MRLFSNRNNWRRIDHDCKKSEAKAVLEALSELGRVTISVGRFLATSVAKT